MQKSTIICNAKNQCILLHGNTHIHIYIYIDDTHFLRAHLRYQAYAYIIAPTKKNRVKFCRTLLSIIAFTLGMYFWLIKGESMIFSFLNMIVRVGT